MNASLLKWVSCVLPLAYALHAHAAGPDAALFFAARAAQPAVIESPKEMASIESGSANVEGLARMADFAERRLKALGAQTERIKATRRPDAYMVKATLTGTGRKQIMLIGLWLLKTPFLLRALRLPPTADTLLGDDVGAPIRPPDLPNIGLLASRPSARDPGATPPVTGAATHSTAAVAARDDRPMRLGSALAPLDRVAHGARHREA